MHIIKIHIMIHNENHQCMVLNYLKSINAEQAKVTHIHKNTKEKLRGTQFGVADFAYHTI